ncbi:hypothetical protein KAH55_07810 [bacterium]|nr:hypothetical protein [bacterium]
MLPSLVQSYALDAIDNLEEKEAAKAARTKTAEQLLGACATAIVNRFPAVGEGHDLRLQGNNITGGALAVEDRIIHLCAFQLAEDEQQDHHRGGRLARASVRRGYRVE